MGRSDSTGETRLMNAREGWNPVANAAPVGLPTLHFLCVDGAVSHRFPAVPPRWLGGRESGRAPTSLSDRPNVSQARG